MLIPVQASYYFYVATCKGTHVTYKGFDNLHTKPHVCVFKYVTGVC